MPHRTSRRRLLLVLLSVTLVVAALDVAGSSAAGPLRGAGAVVFGPLERLAGGGAAGGLDGGGQAVAPVRQAVESAGSTRAAAETEQLRELLESPGTKGVRFVPARVVAVGAQGAAGPARVTIDVGSRDGISTDLTVVAARGLVGRVVSTGPWTSDVLLVGSADLTVGVRVGRAGTLASLGAGARPRPAGQLDLQLVQRGTVAVGDAVTTMGSVGGRPFVAGVRVGTVASVDPAGGQLAPTAAVTPSVDVTSLDVVGVVLPSARTTPRAPVEGGHG